MRWLITAALLIARGVCLAQTPDNDQKLLEELKAVRANLDRLVQLTEEVQKTQQALLAFQQVQAYDSQLRGLEAQRDALAEREADLSGKAAALGASARDALAGIGPNGAPVGEMGSGHRKAVEDRLSETTRLLYATREKQQATERQISALRSRMTQLLKSADQVMAK
ncbi:MAG TPA: hypothetical protein VMJ75_10115 [Candidatus Acidoferrales bacterium]|nr:hypothetical protein [Candidatus Acidoferrales bacterium]